MESSVVPLSRSGFTLLELSISLVIIALIAGMGLATVTAGSSMFESVRRAGTNSKLDVIEDALMAYRTVYNRLPCPADASLATSNANYGVEAANPGTCTGGTPAASFSDATHSVVEGAVPFKQLGLPEEFMYDGWGRKFAYAVNWKVTATRAMAQQALSDLCGVSVTDAGGVAGSRTKGAVYALVSFGADGHGGYLKGGTRLNAGSTNTDEQTNCHCDASAAATAYSANYVGKDATENPASSTDKFDDSVRFKERWQMMTYDDMYQKGWPVCVSAARFEGVGSTGFSGWSVATGDVNGDGYADLIIGAYQENPGGLLRAGSVYVLLGGPGANWGKINTLNTGAGTAIDGVHGFRFDGVAAGDHVGISVATGDINKDGKADLIIGATGTGSAVGSVYIVWGKSSGWSATQTLNTTFLNGGGTAVNGIQLNGENANDTLGISVASGDINNDGKADVIIGSEASPGGRTHAGSVYVVYGKVAGWSVTNTLNTTFLNGGGTAVNGFRLDGELANDYAGFSVASGDVNGDHRADLIIGSQASPGGRTHAGSAYVVYGKAAGWNVTDTLNTTFLNGGGTAVNGFRLDGETASDFAGYSVAAGDINGDSKSDILIGAYNASPGGRTHAGSAYVVYGKVAGWNVTDTLNTTFLNGGGTAVNGFRLDGELANDYAGFSVASGDINGDGNADLIIGAYGADPGGRSSAGSTYVVWGKSSGWNVTDTLNTTFLNGGGTAVKGFRLDGETASDFAGYYVAVGDISGDGKADIITGAYDASPNGVSHAGSTYVVYGKTSGWSATNNLSSLLQ